MRAKVLHSKHADIRNGDLGKIVARKGIGYAVEFTDVNSYGGKTIPTLTIWLAENEVELIEDGIPIPSAEQNPPPTAAT